MDQPQVNPLAWEVAIAQLRACASQKHHPDDNKPIIDLAEKLEFNLDCQDFEPGAYAEWIRLTPIKNEWPRVVVEYDTQKFIFQIYVMDRKVQTISGITFCDSRSVESTVAYYCQEVRKELKYRKYLCQLQGKAAIC